MTHRARGAPAHRSPHPRSGAILETRCGGLRSGVFRNLLINELLIQVGHLELAAFDVRFNRPDPLRDLRGHLLVEGRQLSAAVRNAH